MIIRILNLKTEALVGIYEAEKEQRQPLYVDLEIRFDGGPAARSGDVGDAPDYAALEVEVKELVESRHTGLLETLAAAILAKAFEQSSVTQATVRLRKPRALRWSDTVELEARGSLDGDGILRVD